MISGSFEFVPCMRRTDRASTRGIAPTASAPAAHVPETRPCSGDVTKVQEVSTLVERVCAVHEGRIDVLVNNVGVQRDDGHPLHTLDEAIWDHVLAVNLKSYFLFSKVYNNNILFSEVHVARNACGACGMCVVARVWHVCGTCVARV